MAKKSHAGARVGSGRAVVKRDPVSGELMQTTDLQCIDLPEETAFLIALDNLKNPEVKDTVLGCLKDTHERRMVIMDKAHERRERREDVRNDAEIAGRGKERNYAFVCFLAVLAAFAYSLHEGASAPQLWAFAVFFVGSAGFYALHKWRR